MIRAVLFDAAGVLTAPFGFDLVEDALAAGANAEVLMDVLLPIFSNHTPDTGDTGSTGSAGSTNNTDNTDNTGSQVGNRLERGEVTLEEFFESLGDVRTDIELVIDPTKPTFFGDRWTANSVMHDFVREVHAAGFATALVSNNVREWQETWDRVVPADLPFDVRVYSWKLGARKPEPAMYMHALDELGVAPADALFIDDFPAMAEGARALGMTAIDFVDAESAITEARELLGLPGSKPTR